jgi:hypothetical protein
MSQENVAPTLATTNGPSSALVTASADLRDIGTKAHKLMGQRLRESLHGRSLHMRRHRLAGMCSWDAESVRGSRLRSDGGKGVFR